MMPNPMTGGPQDDLSTDNPIAQPAQGPVLSGPMPMLTAMHTQAKAHYDALDKVAGKIGHIREELDRLKAMGDAVTQDDVLEAAAALVGHGSDPKALVAMMAGNPANGQPPMPSGGEALAAWVAQQDAMVQKQESMIGPAQGLAAHQVITTGLHALVGHHIQGQSQSQSQSQSMPSPMAPSSPTLQ